MPSFGLTITLEWTSLGELGLDEREKLVFPAAAHLPGLYRFELKGFGRSEVYIGETDQLDRRFQHYRTPGLTQRTNIRLNALMRQNLKEGGTVSINTITGGADLLVKGNWRPADLRQKSERVLLEHAALYEAHSSDVGILNS